MTPVFNDLCNKGQFLRFLIISVAAILISTTGTIAHAQTVPIVNTLIYETSGATTTTSGVQVGTSVYDFAQVFPPVANEPTPTGTIVFGQFNNTACSGIPASSSNVPLDVNGLASSPLAVVQTTGLSYLAHYNGDANYPSANGICESVSVSANSLPIVTSVTPASGLVEGGTLVTLTGSGYSSAFAVVFGTATTTNITVNSDSSLTVQSPPGTAGTVDLLVMNAAGRGLPSNTDKFTYENPSPSQMYADQVVSVGLPEIKSAAQIGLNVLNSKPVQAYSVGTGLGVLTLCGVSVIFPVATPGCLAAAQTMVTGFIVDTAINVGLQNVVADPPRQDFTIVEKLQPIMPIASANSSPLARSEAKYVTDKEQQNELENAVLITFERLEGAIAANNSKYMLVQSKALLRFTKQLYSDQEELMSDLNAVYQSFSDQLGDKEFAKNFSDLLNTGLSPSQIQLLTNDGLTAQDIQVIQQEIVVISQDSNLNRTLHDAIQQETLSINSSQKSLSDTIAALQTAIKNLERLGDKNSTGKDVPDSDSEE